MRATQYAALMDILSIGSEGIKKRIEKVNQLLLRGFGRGGVGEAEPGWLLGVW